MNKNKIVLYKSSKGKIDLKVSFDKETVWLSQKQMAELFNKDIKTINEHIQNIFFEDELKKNSVIRKFRITADDGKTYLTNFYNLDVIISVGYRVKSIQGTRFRIWATKVLKNYLVKGYAINQKRILEQKKIFEDFKKTVDFVTSKSKLSQLKSETDSLLDLISDYTNSIYLLTQYDDHNLKLDGLTKKVRYVLTYEETINFINGIKSNFGKKLSTNFGQENGVHNLDGIVGAVNQTFDGKYLYSSVEEQAANLLYMVIKDHPFVDGNKRIGSTLFVYFLNQNRILKNKLGENKISDRALVALALLIATSNPSEKEDLIKLVVNLVK
jgi:prophage maintenance system killer protein